MGKSNTPRRESRRIRILSHPSATVVEVRSAPTTTQALKEFFKDNLKGNGYHHKIVGNVLTVWQAESNAYMFVAQEDE